MVNLEDLPTVGSLVYEFFLRRNSRLAARVKKELKVEKPPANSPNIEQIWADWLDLQRKKNNAGCGDDSSSSSEDEKPAVTLPVSPMKATMPPKMVAVTPAPAQKVVKKESSSEDSSEDEEPATKPQVAPKVVSAPKPAESSSEDSSDDDEGTPANPIVVKKPEIKKESSSSDSSDDDEPQPRKQAPIAKPVAVVPSKAAVKEESDSSDSSSEDEPVSKAPIVKVNPIVPKKDESSSDDSSSEDEPAAPVTNGTSKVTPKVNGMAKQVKKEESSDSSSSDEEPATKAVAVTPKVNGTVKVTKEEESDDSSSEEDTPAPKTSGFKPVAFVPASVSKKRKMNGGGDAPEEKKAKQVDESTPTNGKKKPNVPFKRIQDHVTSSTPGLNDNSFDSKNGFDQWGTKASQSLGAVKGKNFKKEKTKKKRGSYAGGVINTGVNSVKFE